MKNLLILVLCSFFAFSPINAQEVHIDGRLKPYLDDFFKICESYNIPYQEKLFELKNIAIVDTLEVSQQGSTLGMLQRDENHKVENIVLNWMTQLDQEIVRVVAFHEFAHYFLEYTTHVCDDCGIIMSKLNSSYFEIANDWEYQVKILFERSPIYHRIQGYTQNSVAQLNGTN